MSENNINAAISEMKAGLEEASQLEQMKAETAAKKALIDSRKVTSELERQNQDQADLAAIASANYAEFTDAQIIAMQEDHEDYIKAAKEAMTFINTDFDDIVPFFRKNLIFIGAKSGDGKSTAVANIAYAMMRQKNPKTGRRCRTIIMSNEENPGDVYSRVTCLINDWSYTNHKGFTDEQAAKFKTGIKVLAKGGMLTVLSDSFNGATGVTTSVEGIKAVFDNLIKNNTVPDCIILDYYQNVILAKGAKHLNEYEVQANLCRMLDQYKNILGCPIVILGQMDPVTEQNPKPFNMRIQGRKLIVTQSTIIMEMTADRPSRATKWTVWKSRFTEAVGTAFLTGYRNGKYVPYNDAFLAEVAQWRDKQEEKALNRSIGLPEVFKQPEGDEDVPE